MTKVYHTTEIKDNYTKKELDKAMFMEIVSAKICEKGHSGHDELCLNLQKYPKRGKSHITFYYGLIDDIGNSFIKKGVGVEKPEELVGKVVLGIVNMKGLFLEGLCGYD